MSAALVFDYDGTLIDTESIEFEVWQRVYEQHGQELRLEDWLHVVGGSSTQDLRQPLERRVGRSLDWEAIDRRRLEHYHGLFEAQDLLPGVRRLFREAAERGWPIGVASNSSRAWVEKGLKRFGLLGQVGSLRCRDTASRPKPDPAPYVEAVADLGGRVELSFAFEDSKPGVASAKAAGLTVIAIPNSLTRHHDLSAAHRILASLEHFELPERA